MKQKISPKIKQIMHEIASFLEADEFVIYGGTAVDLLSKKGVNDYDIAIKYSNKKRITTVKTILKKKGFEIIEPWREYIIHKNKKVILVYAKNKDYFLDLAFLRDFDLMGLYNIESTQITYPEMKVVDKYKGLKNIKIKRIELIRNINSENPYLLLGRFLYLCSKYNFSLSYFKHEKLLLSLKEKCEKFKSQKEYFRTQVVPSFYAHVFKAILKSKNRSDFINELIKNKIFNNIFPSLSFALNNIIKNKQITTALYFIKDRRELIYFLHHNVDMNTKKEFIKEINKLKIRSWEK